MTDRYTKVLLGIIAVASTVLLTSCSNPDTSGGVTLSKDPHPKNAPFPHGACDDDHAFDERDTGCGWISVNEKSYYIKPYVNLIGADLNHANLIGANLSHAILRYADLSSAYLEGAKLNYADLSGAKLRHAELRVVFANSSTICPNGKYWGTAGNDCGF